jgi:glutathione S-transferase
MKLYYAPGTIAAAVAIALEETALPYETALVDFADAAQTKPDYLRINPKGRVPALDIGGAILTETGAILDWLHTQVPQTGLIPADPLKAARVREAMYYCASTMHVNHAHKRRGARWASREESFADMAAKVPETMTASCAYVETSLLAGPFVTGDGLTAADCYLYTVSCWLAGDGVEVARFPKLAHFREVMDGRPSVRRVRALGIL